MARALGPIRLEIVIADDGVTPHSAHADYGVQDGNAVKVGRYELASAEFAKVLHSPSPTSGEGWTDMVAAIKAVEGIS
jgi:hypothetical protein